MANKKTVKKPVENPEVLNAEVRSDGVGEHPAVQALLADEFSKADDLEAARIARAVYKLIAPEMDKKAEVVFDERFAKYMAWAEAREKERQKDDDDRMKWMEEQITKADKLRATSEYDKAKIAVKTQEMFANAKAEAIAEAADAKLKFAEKCARAPKVQITSYGRPIRTRNGIQYVPEVIKMIIGTQAVGFALKVGEPTEVPDFIATEYANRRREATRLNTLNTDLSADNMKRFEDVAAKHPEIDPRGNINIMSGEEILKLAEANKGVSDA